MFGLFAVIPEEASDSEYIVWLYDTYHRLMFATAGRYLSNPSDREDMVQESLYDLLRSAKTVRAVAKKALPSYIVTTVRNAAIDFLRKQGGSQEQRLSLDDEETGKFLAPISPEDSFLILSRKEQLSAVWQKLSPTDQLLLEWKYIFGFSDRDLALRLDCKPESIRMKLTRARRRALHILKEQEGGPHGQTGTTAGEL